MRHINIMIKPASSLCNMNCGYCFYHEVSASRNIPSHGIMKSETAQNCIINIFSSLNVNDSVNFVFQGGEPTLAGIRFYKNFVNFVCAYSNRPAVSYSLQTNGLLINEEWCLFLKEHQFLVGLSLDGYAKLHNKNRPDNKQNSTFERVMVSKALLDKYSIPYNILCTLTNEIARHPTKIWDFILQNSIDHIQFTPCLPNTLLEKDIWALTPKRFYSFYSSLFECWKRELEKGNYISVKLFDDIMHLLVLEKVTACGILGRCSFQPVVEADGSVYPCDFYAIDKFYLGNLSNESFEFISERALSVHFIDRQYISSEICSTCKYKAICNGGCKKMHSAMCDDTKKYCAYKYLLNDTITDLYFFGEKLFSISS